MKKQPILLLTHNGWGESLLRSVSMIVGKIEEVYEVPLFSEDSLEDYKIRVEKQIQELKYENKLLIITDIKGGTTSNVALSLSRKYELLIVSGLSSQILLECVLNQDGEFTKESVESIIELAREGTGIISV